MKVWLVKFHSGSFYNPGDHIIGICSSEEKADELIEKFREIYDDHSDGQDWYDAEEFEVDRDWTEKDMEMLVNYEFY